MTQKNSREPQLIIFWSNQKNKSFLKRSKRQLMEASYKVWVCLFWATLCFACTPPSSQEGKKKQLLAKVYNKQLYASDLEDILPEAYKPEDSVMIYNAYIENWLRDAVLMHEAEQKISKNINIDKLVQDYRSTLILHNYEQVIVQSELDSVISQEEIQRFYENNKDNYQLESPLLRVQFMKIPIDANELDMVDKWIDSEDLDDKVNLIEYCNTFAEIFYLNGEEWHELDKIKGHIPTNLFPNGTFTQVGNYNKREDDRYKYYLRTLEIIPKNEAPPIDYIENKAKQVILQRRKSQLLDEHREKLYDKEIENVKVFTQ